jgi:subtilisin family serine protease
MTDPTHSWFGQALILATCLVISGSVIAGKPSKMPNHWIVELNDAPTLAYQGERVSLEGHVGRSAKRFEATAPAVTGQARFDSSSPAVQAYTAFLDQRRKQVLSEAAIHLGRDIVPQHVYRHTINGFSIRLSADEVARLTKLPGVKAIHPVTLHHPETDATPEMIGAPIVWNGLFNLGSARGEGVVIGVIDSGINWNSNYFSDTGGVGGHQFTNPFGQQLGLCSNASVQCNDKLVGVYDFTTEGTDGFDSGGHGTHVASIAAGVPFSFSLGGISGNFNTAGVAPHANIVSYKVCYESLPDDPDEAGCPGSAITAALEQALDDGVDVINYSLGGDGTSPWTQATGLLNFWTAGIPFVTSAGNSGPGFGSISSPANAPWVFSIGSSTHDRWIGRTARVSMFSPISHFVLYGTGPELESTLNNRTLVDAADHADGRLACSPFSSGALSNAVVVIERGECTFETKVNHAADAGAIAVLVINNEPGLPITMGGLEDTSIPSAMMSDEAGQAVLDRLALMGEEVVTLSATESIQTRPQFADMVSDFSSRGPGPGAPDVMKPNVLAPGGQFFPGSSSAAAGIIGGSVPDDNSLAFMQGTSMASPGVAGAVALLRQLHPDWTTPMLQSTLETTAAYEPVTWMAQSANLLERGAGRIQVNRAARAGLYLPISQSDFISANPASGGNPGDLNLTGIFRENCLETCATTRTVEALQDGSWDVIVSGDIDIEVSPTSFSLQAGEQQQLEISYGGTGQGQTGLLEGRIHMIPTSSSMVEQTLPVGFLAIDTLLPEAQVIEVDANRGSTVLEIPAATFMPEAVYNTSPLARPEILEFGLEQDPTRFDPFDGEGGTETFLIDVPADTLVLYAETVFSTAPDIDLFVGRDDNENGQADEEELVCVSITPDELEECLIENPQPGTWWILVQNWQASGSGEDDVRLEFVVLTADSQDYSLAARGPGLHLGGALDLDISWDQPAMRRDERWFGALGISSTPDSLADQGIVPMIVTRNQDSVAQPTTLFNGRELPVVIAPQSSHEKLFIDLPSSAEQLHVHVEGDDGVSAEIRSVGFDQLAGWAPDTPPPGTAVHASGSGSADGFELVVGDGGAPPVAARYYVVLENDSNEERLVHVRAELSESDPFDPIHPGWSPQSRDIFQGMEWRRAGGRFMVWYTYDEAGLPVFYNAVSTEAAESSVWRATLLRTTSDGERQTPNAVGEVAVTAIDEQTVSLAWRLNGAHGSEIMIPDVPLTCPEIDGEPFALTGHWFDPDVAAGGTTAVVTGQGGAFVRYYFDGEGIGRWVIAPSTGGFEDLEVLDFRGFCPNCPEQDMTLEDNSSVVGLYSVMFEDASTAIEMLEMITDEPLNDDITLDASIIRISDDIPCLN